MGGQKEVDDGTWVVSFMAYDLGYIDLEQKHCSLSTTRSLPGCHPCLRYVLLPMSPARTHAPWRRGWDSNPRYPCGYAAFRVRCLQPLGHLSTPQLCGLFAVR